MQKYIYHISDYFVKRGIISEEDSEMFRYGLEKRLSTLCIAIPFVIFAIYTTNVVCAITFFSSFFFLRVKTNGLHAHSIIGCIFVSLASEIIFTVLIYPLITIHTQYIFYLFSIMVVLIFAPYIHPHFPLTREEIIALRKQARIRILSLAFISWIVGMFSWGPFCKGLILGMAMAAFMLCLPYILKKGGSRNGKI